MNTVGQWSDIYNNIETLEKYRKMTGSQKDFYLELIKRGTCFVAYQRGKHIHFAPSRFIGYKNNRFSLHKSNDDKDGRTTNKAIKDVLGDWPQLYSELEFEYKKFCTSLGFSPNTTGTFGVARKYWFEPEKGKSSLLKKIKNSSTSDKELIEDIEDINNQKELDKTEKERLISARVGQGWFRERQIAYWKECAITDCNEVSLLRASHIKPWRYSNNKERLDLYNGLLLSPNLDLLFDKGFITFDKNGDIIISRKLSQKNILSLGITKNMSVKLHKQHIPYIKWHKKNVFQK